MDVYRYSMGPAVGYSCENLTWQAAALQALAKASQASSHQSNERLSELPCRPQKICKDSGPLSLCDWLAAASMACPAGVREYQKVNDWVAANPFFRPSFVSGALHVASICKPCKMLNRGHESAVIDSPPDVGSQAMHCAKLQVMGMLAKSNPVAAWHAAEAVRMAAEACRATHQA